MRSASSAPSPSPRCTLSRDRVVEAAVALAEEQGLEAVSIRKVATRLGVTPMALYWHFENKEDLLNAMVDWLYGQMDFSIDELASWQDQLRSILDAEIAILRRYPQTAMLILSRGSTSPNALMIEVESALGALRRAGFSTDDAAKVLTYLEMLVGLVARESMLASTCGSGEQDAWYRRVRKTIQTLPAAQFPNIVEAAESLGTPLEPDSYYVFGVDLLMAGIEAMAQRRATRGA